MTSPLRVRLRNSYGAGPGPPGRCQPTEAALDGVKQRLGPPVLLARALGMAALGEEIKVLPPAGDGLADQFLTLQIALGRVDDVQAGIEGTVAGGQRSQASPARTRFRLRRSRGRLPACRSCPGIASPLRGSPRGRRSRARPCYGGSPIIEHLGPPGVEIQPAVDSSLE